MSGQRKWIKFWARTVGMPVGDTDTDRPKMPPITQAEVLRALLLRTFWIVLHVITCIMIILGNAKTLGWW